MEGGLQGAAVGQVMSDIRAVWSLAAQLNFLFHKPFLTPSRWHGPCSITGGMRRKLWPAADFLLSVLPGHEEYPGNCEDPH